MPPKDNNDKPIVAFVNNNRCYMYLITGGAGFIGSNLLHRLNSAGITDIVVVDSLGSTDKWKNLVGKRFLDFIHRDDFLMLLLEEKLSIKPTAVIHLGARATTTETNADFMLNNNYRYSQLLAKWCVKNGCRFIYSSSAATYGDGSCGFSDSDENTYQLRPLNIYGYSKHLFDLWVLQNGLQNKVAGLKFFNVYGPNEHHKGEMRSVVAKAFEEVTKSGRLRLFKSYRPEFKDGEQKRDFVYVKDVVEIIFWLLKSPQLHGIFNVGSGRARSWKDLATSLFSALKKPVAIDYIEMPEDIRKHYQYTTEAKMDKLIAAGYQGKPHSLEDGVKDYVLSYLKQPVPYI